MLTSMRRPGRENTKPSPRQIRHMIYHLYVAPSCSDFHESEPELIVGCSERAIDLAPPGQEQVCIIVDVSPVLPWSTPIGRWKAEQVVQIRHVGCYAVYRNRPESPEYLAKSLCRASGTRPGRQHAVSRVLIYGAGCRRAELIR